jgi:hypothetical protein
VPRHARILYTVSREAPRNTLVMKTLVVLILLSLLGACDYRPRPKPAADPEPTSKVLTATELFHLRSECAKEGRSLADEMERNNVGSWFTVQEVIHYSPKLNGCYLLETRAWVRRGSKTVPVPHSWVLWNVQTNDTLVNMAPPAECEKDPSLTLCKDPKGDISVILNHMEEDVPK